MRITATISGDIRDIMVAETLATEMAVTAGVRRGTQVLQQRWRGQVRGAGLGSGLTNAIRSRTWPTGTESVDAAGMVWANSQKIVDAFDRGVTIRARHGAWLAIPLPAAGKGHGGRRITPGEWQFRTGRLLRFVPPKGGRRNALLVADDTRISKGGLARVKRGRRRRDGILTGAQTVGGCSRRHRT